MKPGKAKVRPSMEVSAEELNSYLNLTLGPKMPPELSEVVLAIESGRLAGTGSSTSTASRPRCPPQGPWSPLNFLSGRVAVDLKTQLPSRDGMGTSWSKRCASGGSPCPSPWCSRWCSGDADPREPRGLRPSAPFRLPYAVRQVRLEAGKAWLDF